MSNKAEKEEICALLICYDPTLVGTESLCLESQGGLCIETALSSKEAMEKIGKKKPDVIIGDFAGISVQNIAAGVAIIRSIRSKGDMTPFIVFAYDEEKELYEKVFELGAVGFVGKSSDASADYPNLKKCIASLTAHSS